MREDPPSEDFLNLGIEERGSFERLDFFLFGGAIINRNVVTNEI